MEFFVISRENHPVGRAALPPPTSLRNCQRRNGATSRNNHVIARPIGPWQSRGQWCRGKSTGSPRRFAPRNDGGGRLLVLLFRVGGHHGIFRCRWHRRATEGRPYAQICRCPGKIVGASLARPGNSQNCRMGCGFSTALRRRARVREFLHSVGQLCGKDFGSEQLVVTNREFGPEREFL